MSGFFLDDIEIGDKSQRAVNAINDIIGCLRPAENYINQICEKINQIGLSNIRFDSPKRFYDDMEEAASKISAYNRITQEYDNDVDRKFSDKYSDVVSELSSIKVKDITIKNNLGITEIRNTNGYRYPVAKVEIFILEV